MLKKSLLDNRKYRLIHLKNNLKALLIQDQEADASSASIAVKVGSFSDPKEHPGIAHFCEHMLFMGTKKYPESNCFSEFLNRNNGYSNAFTDQHMTVYKFESSNKSFLQALDMFSQFFISPLFDRTTVDKELLAIESEHEKNKQSDLWRQMQLIRSESKENSILNRFSTGNIMTLNPNDNIDQPRQALISFFNEYYHSSKMNLVIDSPIELDEIERITRDFFSEIPVGDGKRSVNYYDKSNPCYDHENLSRFYTIEGVFDRNKLKMQWFLESCLEKYKEKPMNFMSSLLGHEGENTLYSLLTKKNYITELVTSPYNISNIMSIFSISFTLTEKGVENIEEIIKITMKFIRKVLSLPVSQSFYNEIKVSSQISFDYKNREDPIDYTETLAYTIDNYNEEDILSGAYLFEVYNEDLIKTYMSQLTFSNLNIYFTSKNKDYIDICDKEEKWYGTKFNFKPIPALIIEDVKNFNPLLDSIDNDYKGISLGYPPSNKFLPSNFELKQGLEYTPKPVLILKTEKNEVWYKPDQVFNRPKAIIYCQIYLDKSIMSLIEYESIAYTWNLVIDSKMKEVSYMAEEANLKFSFHINNEGLFMKIDGFNDSIKGGIEELLRKFVTIQVDDDTIDVFNLQIKKQIKEMTNFYYSQPYQQAIAYYDYLRIDPSICPNEKYETLIHIENDKNYLKLKEFVGKYMKTMKFQWIIQGNVSKEECIEYINIINKSLDSSLVLSKDKTQSFRVVDQVEKTSFTYKLESTNKNEGNSCLISGFSLKSTSTIKEKVCLEMINSLLKEKFFDSLRTNQGLGYIVSSFLREQRKISSILFVVQSNTKGPEFIWQKINEFLKERREFLSKIDDLTFNSHREALISEKTKKDLGLDEEILRNYNEIKLKEYVFDRKERMINELKSISKEEVFSLFEKVFFEEYRRLDVMFTSNLHVDTDSQVISSRSYEEDGRVLVGSVKEYKLRNKLHEDYMSEYFVAKF